MAILFSPKNIFFITKYSLSKKGRLTPRAAFLLFMKMNYVFGRLQESSEHRMFLKDFSW